MSVYSFTTVWCVGPYLVQKRIWYKFVPYSAEYGTTNSGDFLIYATYLIKLQRNSNKYFIYSFKFFCQNILKSYNILLFLWMFYWKFDLYMDLYWRNLYARRIQWFKTDSSSWIELWTVLSVFACVNGIRRLRHALLGGTIMRPRNIVWWTHFRLQSRLRRWMQW
jgi:hypothetical protein